METNCYLDWLVKQWKNRDKTVPPILRQTVQRPFTETHAYQLLEISEMHTENVAGGGGKGGGI